MQIISLCRQHERALSFFFNAVGQDDQGKTIALFFQNVGEIMMILLKKHLLWTIFFFALALPNSYGMDEIGEQHDSAFVDLDDIERETRLKMVNKYRQLISLLLEQNCLGQSISASFKLTPNLIGLFENWNNSNKARTLIDELRKLMDERRENGIEKAVAIPDVDTQHRNLLQEIKEFIAKEI